MKAIAILLLIAISFYTLSYAKYSWSKKNKSAALGAVLIAVLSIVLPVIVMFSSPYR